MEPSQVATIVVSVVGIILAGRELKKISGPLSKQDQKIFLLMVSLWVFVGFAIGVIVS